MVEWHKNNAPLPSNDSVISESTTMSAMVSTTLTWMRGFQESDAGSYQCVVYRPNTDISVTSETVQLNARLQNTTAQPTPDPLQCSVQETSIHFQIRVFVTGCESWGEQQRAEIADDFRDELLSIVRTECNCIVEESNLQVSGSIQCSGKVAGAAVFRGQIQTNSQQETEQIFCSLFSWQQKSPLMRIKNRLWAVDSICSLEASGSSDSEECVTPLLQDSQTTFGVTEITAVITGMIICILVALLVLLVVAICIYYWRNKLKTRGKNENDHTYNGTTILLMSCINLLSYIIIIISTFYYFRT